MGSWGRTPSCHSYVHLRRLRSSRVDRSPVGFVGGPTFTERFLGDCFFSGQTHHGFSAMSGKRRGCVTNEIGTPDSH